MTAFDGPEWSEIFLPDGSLAGAFVRGTLVYFGVLGLFRLILKRQAGAIGLTDVMLAVMVSECVSNALGGSAKSLPNGLVTVAAMLFWNYVLDWSAYRWPAVRRLIEPAAVTLVENGQVVEAGLREERIGRDELLEQLRQNGLTDVSQVRLAMMEGCGAVSVIPKDDDPPPDLARVVTELNELTRRLSAVLDRLPPPTEGTRA